MRAFTLIELLVVVAIIGILAAVGVVAYNGYTGAAKVNAAKTNYKNVIRWVKTELVKCNAGLSDKMFTSNPQSCPITHSNNSPSRRCTCQSSGLIIFKELELLIKLSDSFQSLQLHLQLLLNPYSFYIFLFCKFENLHKFL